MKKKLGAISRWVSSSESETKKIGKLLAKKLIPGSVVALYGELGAGKTTLVKGIADGLGIRSQTKVSSPTFVVIHEYSGKCKIYHLDWYRIKKVKGVDAQMAQECFYSQGITLVEWPQRGENLLPEHFLEVRISHQNLTTRIIEVSAK